MGTQPITRTKQSYVSQIGLGLIGGYQKTLGPTLGLNAEFKIQTDTYVTMPKTQILEDTGTHFRSVTFPQTSKLRTSQIYMGYAASLSLDSVDIPSINHRLYALFPITHFSRFQIDVGPYTNTTHSTKKWQGLGLGAMARVRYPLVDNLLTISGQTSIGYDYLDGAHLFDANVQLALTFFFNVGS